jgi:hypothetical protein
MRSMTGWLAGIVHDKVAVAGHSRITRRLQS